MAIPAEAATELLTQARPLEPSTATRTHPVDQDGDLTAGEPHLPGPAPTLTANRREATGGDPGPDRSGAHLEALDDLRDSHKDVVGSRIHGGILSYGENQCKPFYYVTSHNMHYVYS
jgi:hypothetical protein